MVEERVDDAVHLVLQKRWSTLSVARSSLPRAFGLVSRFEQRTVLRLVGLEPLDAHFHGPSRSLRDA